MNIIEYTRLALIGLASNKMRTALTMLGIIIGVGVVILVVAIGEGASKNVTDAINSLGTNLLSIRPSPSKVKLNVVVTRNAAASGTVQTGTANKMTLDDAKEIAIQFPTTVDAVAPQVRGNTQIRYGSNNASVQVIGTTIDYPHVNNVSVSTGRFFTDLEDQGGQKVCVVGKTTAMNLTNDPNADLTGNIISINSQGFTVLGMLAPKGSGAFGQDQDDVILTPINTAMRRVLNKSRIDFLSVRCTTPAMMVLATQQISSFLRNRHRIRPPYPDNDDFQITNQTELMARQTSVTDTMTTLLSAVAVISLVVGGIGIMNIMLVSVTERTREIGIRKAVGATPRDILMQFLIESAIISIIGGLIGVIVGVGGAYIMSATAGWNTIVNANAVLVALFVSAGIGLFFGIYPASKASALHPIEALRYE